MGTDFHNHSDFYETYMRSAAWDTKRVGALRRAGYKCERCSGKNRVLEVHHKTYERLGRELPQDLEVVCERCHVGADGDRAWRTKMRRLDGWARKVYGPNWLNEYTFDEVQRAFDAWLKRKGYN